MTEVDYRHMASEIRELIPLLMHPQTVADLRLLADRYERLAHCLELAPDKLPHMPFEYACQAGGYSLLRILWRSDAVGAKPGTWLLDRSRRMSARKKRRRPLGRHRQVVRI